MPYLLLTAILPSPRLHHSSHGWRTWTPLGEVTLVYRMVPPNYKVVYKPHNTP